MKTIGAANYFKGSYAKALADFYAALNIMVDLKERIKVWKDYIKEHHNEYIKESLKGEDIEARWWSVTVYGSDGFLIENSEKLYSYNSENINYNINGGFEIFFLGKNDFISEIGNKNWLRVKPDENFSLSLRLYGTNEELFSNLRRVNLPIIEKLRCIE
mgnify:CR=1 FL=1